MASILQLKRRILAAQNVSKTTRAMQMIAASKLKRAQDAALFGRPYAEKLISISKNLALKTVEEYTHPYLAQKKNYQNSLLIVFAPDKGLCGGLISGLTRELLAEKLKKETSFYLTVGKKIERVVTRLGKEVIASFKFGTTLPPFDAVFPIIKIIDECFLGKRVDRVAIVGSAFLNVFSQKPNMATILPIELPQDLESKVFTLFEPVQEVLLPALLKHYLEITIYQHMLESYASEQAARMVAMRNATDNALEIASDLRLEYNKERQEKITNEILDIGGASVLQI